MHQVDELKTAAGDGNEQKVVFQPEQQAKVQELIDEAYRKAYAKAQRSRGGEDVERLKAEVERLREERKNATILRALSRHNVVDAEEAAELIKSKVREEGDGSLTVVGETGTARINTAGIPMSIDEFVSNWLAERPHHLRGSGHQGAGSQGARYGVEGRVKYDLSDPSVWQSMPREDLERLLREGINVRGAAGQSYSFRDVKNPFIEARKRKYQANASK